MPTKLIFCSVFTSHYSKLLPLEQSLYLTKYSVKHEPTTIKTIVLIV